MVCTYTWAELAAYTRSGLFIDIYLCLRSTQLSFLSRVEMNATRGERQKGKKLRHYRFYSCCFISIEGYARQKREKEKEANVSANKDIIYSVPRFVILSWKWEHERYLFFAWPSLRVFLPDLFLNKFRYAIPFPFFSLSCFFCFFFLH